MSTTASEIIADYAIQRRSQLVDDATVEAVARVFLDTYAVAIAGGRHEVRDIALGAFGASDGAARDWNTGSTLRADDAAFINGVSGHILDFDDVTSPLRGHPSIATVPPLVALAEEIGATGEDVSLAYETGFEVICRLARPLITTHYVKGWHSTATIGLIGATVACAQLLRLERGGIIDAIGLAVASAAGTRQNFGSLAKCFQAGNGAAAAIRATRLAQAGMSASPGALDGTLGGFVGLYTDAASDALEAELADIGSGDGELRSTGIEVKKYPLCYATHRALDGLLDLRSEHGLDLDRVAGVRITTNNGGLVPLIHDNPQTGLEAKFSMQFAVAAALKFGEVRLATFQDEIVRAPDIQAFLPRVQAQEAEGDMFPRWTELVIERTDGEVITHRVEQLRGSAEVPLTTDELTAKVADCFSFGGRTTDPAVVVKTALAWRQAQISDVLDAAQN